MKVSEVMTRNVRTCAPDDSAADAARIMWDQDCGVVPVVQGGRLQGLVTDRDLLMATRIQGRSPYEVPLSAIPPGRVETCRDDADVEDALAKMASRQVRRLPVVDRNDRLVGIVTLNDISLAARDSGRMLAVAHTLAAIGRHRQAAAAT